MSNFITQRRLLLVSLSLPLLGCTISPLSNLTTSELPASTVWPYIRPPQKGQSWTYKVLNFYNSLELDVVRETVAEVDTIIRLDRYSSQHGILASEIQSTWGRIKQEPTWENVNTYESPLPLWPQVFSLGAKDRVDTYYLADSSSFQYWISLHSQISSFERLELDSGTFDTIRVDKFIRLSHPNPTRLNLVRTEKLWLAPEIGRWVVRETNGIFMTSGRRQSEGREDHLRWELTNWV